MSAVAFFVEILTPVVVGVSALYLQRCLVNKFER